MHGYHTSAIPKTIPTLIDLEYPSTALLAMMIRISLLYLFLTACSLADVKSTTDQVKFDIQSDNQAEMTLSETGLGIGLSPGANLHVNGNAIVSDQLFIGGSSGSSNLNIHGAIGFGIQTVSSNTVLGLNSVVLADTSSDNIILTLPNPENVNGRIYKIKKLSNENQLELDGGGYHIDRNEGYFLTSGNSSSLQVVSNGSEWYLINSFVTGIRKSNRYDVSTAKFNSSVLDVSAQHDTPRSILFNDDGSRLYILGSASDNISQYDLSTAYDVSTGSLIGTVLDVSSEDGEPHSMIFNNDGTKLYVLGASGDDINQYDLSVAYDISSATFSAIALNVNSEESAPRSILFNNDGTKLYVLGQTGDDINHYDLSIAFDITSASFNSIALDVSSQDTAPTSIKFNNNGTKLYVVGNSGNDINEYELETPYDISTASFNSIALDVSPAEGGPQDFIFNSDGTRFYLIGVNGDDINQYDISP